MRRHRAYNELRSRRSNYSHSRGIASVEFALLLPFLLLIALAVFDVAGNIQAELILTNISREGANLSLRAALTSPASMQQVLSALTATTAPLDMGSHGMIYLTEIMGNDNCDGQNNNCTGVVLNQFRWIGGTISPIYAPVSNVWNCGQSGSSWSNDGSCTGIPDLGANPPQVQLLTGQLFAGQIAFVAEAFYSRPSLLQRLFFGDEYIPDTSQDLLSTDLYAMTVF